MSACKSDDYTSTMLNLSECHGEDCCVLTAEGPDGMSSSYRIDDMFSIFVQVT